MFGLFPGDLFTVHGGVHNVRALSPKLWRYAQSNRLPPDGGLSGSLVGDEFVNFGAIAPAISGTTAGVNSNGYGFYVDTATSACSIRAIATSLNTVRFATGATDNHEAWLTSGGNTGVLGVITDTIGESRKLIFEARFRVGQVGNTYNIFVGLAEEGCAVADTVTDAGAMVSKDYIGFKVAEAAGSALQFVYRRAGAAEQVVFTRSPALVADTWYKVGFVFDPEAPASERIRIVIDNELQGTFVTATNVAAAVFPDGEELAFLAGIKNGTASVNTLDLNWWAAFPQQ